MQDNRGHSLNYNLSSTTPKGTAMQVDYEKPKDKTKKAPTAPAKKK